MHFDLKEIKIVINIELKVGLKMKFSFKKILKRSAMTVIAISLNSDIEM